MLDLNGAPTSLVTDGSETGTTVNVTGTIVIESTPPDAEPPASVVSPSVGFGTVSIQTDAVSDEDVLSGGGTQTVKVVSTVTVLVPGPASRDGLEG